MCSLICLFFFLTVIFLLLAGKILLCYLYLNCCPVLGVHPALHSRLYTVRDPGFYARPKRFPRPGVKHVRKMISGVTEVLDQNSFLFSTSIELSVNKIKPEKNYKTRYKSSFQSDRKGILYINLPQEENSNRKVRFSRLEIKFY